MIFMIKLSRQAGLGATPEGLLTKVEEEVKVRKESSFSSPTQEDLQMRSCH